MRNRLIIIFSLLLISSCCRNIKEAVDTAGYTYDSRQDIYVSKLDPWQRRMGYSAIFDLASTPVGMVIDCEPVIFDSLGKTYMIELWKGQYDLSTGAEIGIYSKSESALKTWDCGGNAEMLDMSYSLKKNGIEVFNRDGKHWWLTGFKPGEFSNPEELTMDITIKFDNHPEWKIKFKNKLIALGYDNNKIDVNGNTIKFTFNIPKSKQPNAILLNRSQHQAENKSLVEQYNKAKSEASVTDSSPCSIAKILEKNSKLIISHIFK
jgi:hypothetical protein